MLNRFFIHTLPVIILGLALLCMASCMNPYRLIRALPTSLDTINAQSEIKEPQVITVWIHGTRLTPPSIMHDFFYRKLGMHPAHSYESRYHMHKVAHALCPDHAPDYQHDHLYFFGWSGKLSFKEREIAAQELYHELSILHNSYLEKYRQAPTFRLITHSHGGNVALNLARVKGADCPFAIHELILLACPVQNETMHLIADALFEKIYSFYSKADLIQVIDPQGIYKNKTPQTPLFSRHLFAHHDKLVQVETRVKKRGFSHLEFLLLKFITHLPAVMNTVKNEPNLNIQKKLTLELVSHRPGSKTASDAPFIVKHAPLDKSPTRQS